MGSGPQAPDSNQLNQQQTQSNIGTATAQQNINAVNQRTPYGNLTYNNIGTNPDGTQKMEAVTTLSPEQQQLYNTYIGNQQNTANAARQSSSQLGGLLAQPVGSPSYQQFGSGPQLGTNGGDASGIQMSISGAGDYGAERQRVEDALMGRLNTQFDQDRASLESSLANKGIKQGSAAYTAAMGDYGRGVAEGRTSAILGAGQEQNRLQGLDLNAGNFANSAQNQRYGQTLNNATFGNSANQQMFENQRGATAANNQLSQQQMADQITRRNQGINELQALQGGSQIQSGGFAQTPQVGVANTDVSGNAWNQYNAQQQQSNGMWNAIGSVGGTVGGWMFSDERLKTDKEKIGETPGGVGVYNYRYKGSPMMQMGVMAQELKKTQPEAVAKTPSGFLAVDYRRVK